MAWYKGNHKAGITTKKIGPPWKELAVANL